MATPPWVERDAVTAHRLCPAPVVLAILSAVANLSVLAEQRVVAQLAVHVVVTVTAVHGVVAVLAPHGVVTGVAPHGVVPERTRGLARGLCRRAEPRGGVRVRRGGDRRIVHADVRRVRRDRERVV